MTGLEPIVCRVQGGYKGKAFNKAVIINVWNLKEFRQTQKFGCKVFGKLYRTEDIVAWIDVQETVTPVGRKLIDF